MGATRNTGYLQDIILYDSSNNVGISTAVDPSYKVTLGGSLSGTAAVFSSSVTSTAFVPTGSSIPTNGMYLSAANTLNFATNSASRLSISTSTITSTLAISGTSATFASTAYTNLTVNGTNATGWGNNIAFQSGGTDFGYVGSYGSLVGSTTKDMTVWATSGNGFRVNVNGGSSSVLTISSTGAATFTGALSGTSATFSGGINQGGGTLNYNQTLYTGGVNASYLQIANGSTGPASANGLLVGLDGSGNAYFNQQSAFNLYLKTNGINALTISTTGAASFSSSVTQQYGIFTGTTPAYPTSGQGIIDGNSGNLRLFAYGDINFYTSSTQNVVIKNGGSVGIGINSPEQLLTVAGGSISVSGNTGLPRQILELTTASTVAIVRASYQGAGSYGDLALWTGGSERMRITSGGNVYIGSTSGDYGKLDVTVSPSSYTAALGLGVQTNSSEGNSVGISFKTKISLSGAIWENARIAVFTDGVTSSAYGSMAFYTMNATTLTERMRITSGGNIRTYVTPSVDTHLEWYNTTGNTFVGDIWCDGNPRLNIRCISGGVYLSSGATSWTAASDETLKDINSIIEGAIDKINTLRAVSFSWKSDESKKENLGLIAQDIEKVFPQVIDKNKDGIKGVRYTEMIPVLVKAIQELKAELDSLKK